MVLAKLQNSVLDTKGAISYIMKVIAEKTEQYNVMKVNYARKVSESKYSKTKSEFKGKAKTNSVDISATSFNNFEPRQYNYDDLEKRLLGWA